MSLFLLLDPQDCVACKRYEDILSYCPIHTLLDLGPDFQLEFSTSLFLSPVGAMLDIFTGMLGIIVLLETVSYWKHLLHIWYQPCILLGK